MTSRCVYLISLLLLYLVVAEMDEYVITVSVSPRFQALYILLSQEAWEQGSFTFIAKSMYN